MSTSSLVHDFTPRTDQPFAPQHQWDRNFFLAYLVLIWLGIGMGFGSDVIHHVTTHERAYPLIVHVHAATFMTWLALFSAQILLIRTGRTAIHRKLGYAMIPVAVAMVLIGPATAYVVQRTDFGTPHSDPAFLSIQLTDMTAFAGLIGAAVLLRNKASAHKRLTLLSVLFIADAGYARWLGEPITHALGTGWWGNYEGLYLATDVLILGLGAYDLVTRKRLHPAYVGGVAWGASQHFLANWLYFLPAWKPVALSLIGH
ncbi:MAG: hypothetical protein JF588_18890 [Caulobacterales bacterium]|nr:hypothetical protein [Caulobacterales bacterium]